jgi:hypothetical protein
MLLAGLLTSAAGALGAELVMFDDPGCVWCRRWNAEIAPSYARSREGQRAPLRRVPIRDQARAGVALARPVNVTPTFVLAEDGQEVGRIDGYAGRNFFYAMLAELLARLPPPDPRLRPPLQRSAVRVGSVSSLTHANGEPPNELSRPTGDTRGRRTAEQRGCHVGVIPWPK